MSVPLFSHFKMELVQYFPSAQRRKADEGVSFCKEKIFPWFQSTCKEQSLRSGPVVTIQEQHHLGQNCHGHHHHAVFFSQVVGGRRCPYSSSSPKSTRVPWIGGEENNSKLEMGIGQLEEL